MRVTFCRPRSASKRRAACVAAVLLLAMPRASASAQTAVDLQLVLAVDVSGSVNAQRFELQKMGYVGRVPEQARAQRHPRRHANSRSR